MDDSSWSTLTPSLGYPSLSGTMEETASYTTQATPPTPSTTSGWDLRSCFYSVRTSNQTVLNTRHHSYIVVLKTDILLNNWATSEEVTFVTLLSNLCFDTLHCQVVLKRKWPTSWIALQHKQIWTRPSFFRSFLNTRSPLDVSYSSLSLFPWLFLQHTHTLSHWLVPEACV